MITKALLGVFIIFSVSLCWAQTKEQADPLPFDHLGIGFDLEGAHTVVPCEGCHLGQRFAGTPRECGICHSLNGLVQATAKSITHIPTTEDCESCHRTTVWNDITYVDHTQTIGACEVCHNGINAGGKSPNHVFTTEACDVCHSDLSWTPALFDHGNISSGCSGCHNGVIATGKNAGHIPSNDLCESCHSTLAWQPAFVDHSAVFGECSGCHNGSLATGKSSTHFVTAQECDRCHSTVSWQADIFTHATPNYPGDHAVGLDCIDCHTGNSSIIPWVAAAFQPNCGACHASDFVTGPHIKSIAPQTFYNLSELQDCSGACHIYSDDTFTEVTQFRAGNHSVNDSDF